MSTMPMPWTGAWWPDEAAPSHAKRSPAEGSDLAPLQLLSGTRGGRTAVPALQCIPVRALARIVIVRVSSIVRLEADDNFVRIWADRMYLHKESLTSLVARLDAQQFLRIHRSHAVRIDCVRELVPRSQGEYLVRLANGFEVASARSYRGAIRAAFGLG